MAFQMLGLNKEALLSDRSIQNFGKLQGLSLSLQQKGKGLPHRMTKGDKMMQIINVANLYDMPIREYMITNKLHEFPISEVEDLAVRYKNYKLLNSVYDYTDMLIMAKSRELDIPELDYLFIDEAQDLSTLQWILVDRLASKAGKIIIAGDDKQAIGIFSGADVDTFLSLPGKVEVLQQSYRIPKAVFAQANNLMKRMTKFRREGSNWKPRKEEGVVKRVSSIPLAELAKGDWLVLARGGYQLETLRDQLLNCGKENPPLYFTVNNAPPIDLDAYRVLGLFEMYKYKVKEMQDLVTLSDDDPTDLRKQKLEYILLLKKFVSTGRNNMQPWEVDDHFRLQLVEPWYVAMDRLTLQQRNYLKYTYNKYIELGNDLFKDVLIRLMTIHASKGREADNVLVYLNVPKVVEEELLLEESDVEVKTFYVAITRAKKKLLLYKHKHQHRCYDNLI